MENILTSININKTQYKKFQEKKIKNENLTLKIFVNTLLYFYNNNSEIETMFNNLIISGSL